MLGNVYHVAPRKYKLVEALMVVATLYVVMIIINLTVVVKRILVLVMVVIAVVRKHVYALGNRMDNIV